MKVDLKPEVMELHLEEDQELVVALDKATERDRIILICKVLWKKQMELALTAFSLQTNIAKSSSALGHLLVVSMCIRMSSRLDKA